jgi:hypothetical protein
MLMARYLRLTMIGLPHAHIYDEGYPSRIISSGVPLGRRQKVTPCSKSAIFSDALWQSWRMQAVRLAHRAK